MSLTRQLEQSLPVGVVIAFRLPEPAIYIAYEGSVTMLPLCQSTGLHNSPLLGQALYVIRRQHGVASKPVLQLATMPQQQQHHLS